MSLIWRGPAIEKAMEAEFNRRLEIAALIVLRSAKQLCAVDTGRLRNSIVHEVVKKDLTAFVGTLGKPGSGVEYAPYVELGTRKMAAQPFLRPGLANNKPRIIRILTLGNAA